MNTELVKVSLRQKALFVEDHLSIGVKDTAINETTLSLVANSNKLGFTYSEELLKKLNSVSPKVKLEFLELLKEVTGVNKNWTPLVKQWDIPTGESILDHLFTAFANIFKSKKGTELPCGHTIPENTFPLERYNGCPFCGTPFSFEKLDLDKSVQGKLEILQLWSINDLKDYFSSLLASPVPLEATQVDSLKIMLKHLEIPSNVSIGMKETLMLVVDELIANKKEDIAGSLFKSPNELLRYLWYKHTGFLQIVEPKTIAKQIAKNYSNVNSLLDQSHKQRIKSLKDLKLKYNRQECKMYASWLNQIELTVEKQCEMMHAKRGIWVRVIRALRLSEYSKKQGFEKLALLLDVFYNQKYEVWQGRVNHFRLKYDAENTFELMKQRPSLFARSLFSLMLWFGKEETLKHFREVMGQIPKRLIFTLNMYAENYFDPDASRSVKTLGGIQKRIPTNKLLQLYDKKSLRSMQDDIQGLSLSVIKKSLSEVENKNKTIFIEESLYKIPIAIGDRSDAIQDLPNALMGTRFPIKGEKVRLFLQWGMGLKAQHLDMDLSCKVIYENRTESCSYSQLVIDGCKHSGDIQRIPNKVGTAEYIDIDTNSLLFKQAKYVVFTCNAYTNGSLSPNMVVGWMDSQYPMKVSSNGVAYHPAHVQHQVRIKQNLTKGLVFGVLDIELNEIIWLEMSFSGQTIRGLDAKGIASLINKMDAKLKVGDLLKLKAEVQHLQIVEDAENADEAYDEKWVRNTAEVSKLFLE